MQETILEAFNTIKEIVYELFLKKLITDPEKLNRDPTFIFSGKGDNEFKPILQ
jgi:hypothetical protein